MENLQLILKEKIKNTKIIYPLAKAGQKVFTCSWVKFCNILYLLSKKESPCIGKYKGIHAGKRCFIVATGPSLTMKDLNLIKSEYTFSMNSIVNIFDKTQFRPTYYLLQDGHVEKRLREQLKNIDITSVCDTFIGICNYYGNDVSISKMTFNQLYNKGNWYNLNYIYHCLDSYYDPSHVKMRFSENIENEAMDGFTVTYTAIELAAYMGFREIYLLGCDTTYGGHVDEADSDKHPQKNEPAYFNILAYKEAKKYGDAHNIKIFNATRGGMLEVFPRVNLDELFEGDMTV